MMKRLDQLNMSSEEKSHLGRTKRSFINSSRKLRRHSSLCDSHVGVENGGFLYDDSLKPTRIRCSGKKNKKTEFEQNNQFSNCFRNVPSDNALELENYKRVKSSSIAVQTDFPHNNLYHKVDTEDKSCQVSTPLLLRSCNNSNKQSENHGDIFPLNETITKNIANGISETSFIEKMSNDNVKSRSKPSISIEANSSETSKVPKKKV